MWRSSFYAEAGRETAHSQYMLQSVCTCSARGRLVLSFHHGIITKDEVLLQDGVCGASLTLLS